MPLEFFSIPNVGTEESLFNISWFKVFVFEWSQIKNLSVKFLNFKVFVRLVFKFIVHQWELKRGFYCTVNVIITKCSVLQTRYLSPFSSIRKWVEISYIITYRKYLIASPFKQHVHFFWNHYKPFNSADHSKISHCMFRHCLI